MAKVYKNVDIRKNKQDQDPNNGHSKFMWKLKFRGVHRRQEHKDSLRYE